jgi:4-aminobutyrate aminotransferase-like enzyme
MTDKTLWTRREQALGAGAALFYKQPLHIVRGEGCYLFDVNGRRYIDMYNNVPCVGHGNAHVVEAMARQQATLNVHSRYLHEGIVAFAERLAALHAPAIESTVFSCSGTEATEVALQIARIATRRRGIVCSDAAYHGNSDLVGQLTDVGSSQPESAEVHCFPFPQLYRPLVEGLSEAALCEAYLDRLHNAIQRFETTGAGFAGLIVCSILANEGLPNVPAGFMGRAAEMVRSAGGLVIVDEVQAGYCRTGRWWGYEASNFAPDIVIMGKPMGNGLPLAATAASKGLIDMFRAKTHYFNTFASSPLQAAVGMAVLDVIEKEGLREHAGALGAWLLRALTERKTRCASIGDVRGRGLFLGVEMIKDEARKTPDAALAFDFADRLKNKGFLTSNDGVFRNVLKIRPPLVFSQSDAAEFLDAFDSALTEIDG